MKAKRVKLVWSRDGLAHRTIGCRLPDRMWGLPALLLSGAVFLAGSARGQTTYTGPTDGNASASGNWSGGAPANNEARFDGANSGTGPLALTLGANLGTRGNSDDDGSYFRFTENQTEAVTITASGAQRDINIRSSTNVPVFKMDAGAGAVTIGGGAQNIRVVSGSTSHAGVKTTRFVNDSSSLATFGANVQFLTGASRSQDYYFLGSGAGGFSILGSLHNNQSAVPESYRGRVTVEMNGAAPLTLGGDNLLIDGGFLLKSGTVRIGHNNAFGSGQLTVDGDVDIEITYHETRVTNHLAVTEDARLRLRRYQPSLSTARFTGGISGAGTIEIGGQFISDEYGTRFSGDNTGFTGTLKVNTFAILVVDDAVQQGNILPNAVLDINGGTVNLTLDADQTYHIGTLAGATPSTNSIPTIRGNTANRIHTLSVGARNEDSLFAGKIDDGLGTVALTKVGAGKLTVAGGTVNISGGLTVQAGILELDDLSSLAPGCTNIMVNGGTLALSPSAPLPETAVVKIQGTGKIDLAAGVDQVVGRLLVNGIPKVSGTYGSTASAAKFKNDDYFSGTGLLRIIPSLSGTIITMW